MSLSFTTRKRIRPEMNRKTDPDGVCLVYSEVEERSIRVPSKALSNASNDDPSNASNDDPSNASNDDPSNDPSNSVITQQPTDTIPKNDDVIIDTLEFDCFLCYRWWFCYK